MSFFRMLGSLLSGLFGSNKGAPASPAAPAVSVPSDPDSRLVPSAPPPIPRWLALAEKEIGVEEVAGPGNNPRILYYHQATSLKATVDEVPWCAAFVGRMLLDAGVRPSGSAAARSYLTWGVRLAKPTMGCVVVLWRGTPKSPNGHVGFFVDQGESTVTLLGGNQGDRVCESKYLKSRVLGYFWPAEAKLPPKESFSTMIGEIPHDYDDVEVSARTAWGEARDQGEKGIVAVLWVIRNRVMLGNWMGRTPTEVCRKPKQFSCWDENDPNRPKLINVAIDEDVMRVCMIAARNVFEGRVPDPTRGATHYYDTKMMKAPPPWTAPPAVRTADIGSHRFFKGVK